MFYPTKLSSDHEFKANCVTSLLMEGDLVLNNGMIWKLENHRKYRSKRYSTGLHCFDAKPVGWWEEPNAAFPERWMNEWNVQGNDNRLWTTVCKRNNQKESA